MLWAPGTAQIGEGGENSWGDFEESEKEEEEIAEEKSPTTEDHTMETGDTSIGSKTKKG